MAYCFKFLLTVKKNNICTAYKGHLLNICSDPLVGWKNTKIDTWIILSPYSLAQVTELCKLHLGTHPH